MSIHDFSKSREPFRNIPKDGMLPPTRPSLNEYGRGYTDKKQTIGLYKWRGWFCNIKPKDKVRIKISAWHDICNLHPTLSEKDLVATVKYIDHEKKQMILSVPLTIGKIPNAYVCFYAIFDKESSCYYSHNGVFIKGKYHE